MTPEQITALINLGAAGAVIVVTVYFLRFIEKRDRDWQAFFQALYSDKDAPMEQISEALQTLLSEFRAHDSMEKAKLDEMSRTIHATRPTHRGGQVSQ
jgi:hypothetical protein